MAGTFDILARERQIGNEAVTTLRTDFKEVLSRAINISGASKKSTVRSRFRDGRLDRLTFVAPDYVFKQNFGFEGQKKNGVNMRLKATDVLNKALQKSGVLVNLADDLAELRAEEIMVKMNFNGRQ